MPSSLRSSRVPSRVGRGVTSVRLLCEGQAVRTHMGLKCGPESVVLGAERWIARIVRACPAVDRDRAVWLLSFVISITCSVHLTNGWIDDFLSSDQPRGASELTRLVVSFCLTGIVTTERDGTNPLPLAKPASVALGPPFRSRVANAGGR